MKSKVRGKIFGSLKSGSIEIQIAYGFGMNNGGGLQRLNQNEVPINCRIPNTYVWLYIENGQVIKIEKMTAEEVMENE